MDKVFSLKNKVLKILEKWKNTGKVREFCQPGKVRNMFNIKESMTSFLFPVLTKTRVERNLVYKWES